MPPVDPEQLEFPARGCPVETAQRGPRPHTPPVGLMTFGKPLAGGTGGERGVCDGAGHNLLTKNLTKNAPAFADIQERLRS